MKAIILAAGRGSRLNHMTEDQPKCLMELSGRTLLDWQLRALRGAGISEIAVVRGYLPHKIDRPDLKYFENPRWSETQMLRSLLCADEWLEQDVCVVSYADIAYPAETIRSMLAGEGDIVMPYNTEWLPLWTARFSDPLSDAETFRVDDSGILLEIGGRAATVEEIKGQYMGLLLFRPAGWRRVRDELDTMPPEKVDKLDMTALFRLLLAAEIRIQAVPIAGKWYELDDEKDYEYYSGITDRITADLTS